MSKRIFIIDDDRDHAESLAEVLEMRGHEVALAHSGEEAVELFKDADFDLVLLDVKLPGMNGVETFVEFRRLRPDARVMMMTGYSVEQLVAQAVEQGALGVLHKPFSAAELIALVENVRPKGLVLLADDDPEIAASLAPILARHGYRVELARTGQEAFEAVTRGGVDCLLLDLRLPVLSGVEVYMRLKETRRLVPTILITGHATDEAAQRLSPLTQGMLVKPFEAEVLLDTIARLESAA
jgi:two-component system, NtrC family, response regulator HydG